MAPSIEPGESVRRAKAICASSPPWTGRGNSATGVGDKARTSTTGAAGAIGAGSLAESFGSTFGTTGKTGAAAVTGSTGAGFAGFLAMGTSVTGLRSGGCGVRFHHQTRANPPTNASNSSQERRFPDWRPVFADNFLGAGTCAFSHSRADNPRPNSNEGQSGLESRIPPQCLSVIRVNHRWCFYSDCLRRIPTGFQPPAQG